jgi:O-methyltransferase involved in polyketide biosynthesis
MEQAIQSTGDDAARAKAATVAAGYYDDPFIKAFVTLPSRPVQPIIKRGTHARVCVMDRAIRVFLELQQQTQCEGQQRKQPQVVVLGAGNDTTFFRLQKVFLLENYSLSTTIKWYELDYEAVVRAKASVIAKTPVFAARPNRHLKTGIYNVECKVDAKEAPWSNGYYLVPFDFNDGVDGLLALLANALFDAHAPTLFVVECVQMYLPEPSVPVLLRGLYQMCRHNAYVCMYEPILGADPFGTVMETNLIGMGVVNQQSCLLQSRTLETHMQKLVAAGFTNARGCDMWSAYQTVVTADERKRANASEFLDEIEEWMLIMQHYCFIVASTESSSFGKEFCSVGKSSPMGFAPGRCKGTHC